MFDKTYLKGLTVAAIGAGAMLVASTADAAVNFRPGTSTNGAGACNNYEGFVSGGQVVANLCAGSASVGLDLMTWDTGDVGLADSTWNMNINSATGDFTETFMMGLTHTSLGTAETVYGLNRSFTYVTMELNLTGNMTSFDTTVGDPTDLVGTYDNSSTLTMRFHEDGTPDPGLADGAVIAEFVLTNGGSVGPGNDATLTELKFRATFDNTAGTPDGIFGNGAIDFNDLISPILTVTTNSFLDGEVTSSSNPGTTVVLVGRGSRATTRFSVSEPGAMALFGLGLVGLSVAVRRKRKAAA